MQHYIWFYGHFHITFTSSNNPILKWPPPLSFFLQPSLIFFEPFPKAVSQNNYIFGSKIFPPPNWLASISCCGGEILILIETNIFDERDFSFFPDMGEKTIEVMILVSDQGKSLFNELTITRQLSCNMPFLSQILCLRYFGKLLIYRFIHHCDGFDGDTTAGVINWDHHHHCDEI